jgi:DNA mismatch endonuclease (patch repair protein)
LIAKRRSRGLVDLVEGVMHRSNSKSTQAGRLTTTPERSELLSRVRQRGTAPEAVVQEMLTRLGHAHRTNVRGLPGSPDVVAADGSRAVLVHGCYWHRHSGCSASSTPKHNSAFWLEKFVANVRRDRRNARELRRLGYRVMTVWECQTKSAAKRSRLARRLDQFFRTAQ